MKQESEEAGVDDDDDARSLLVVAGLKDIVVLNMSFINTSI